MRPESFPVSPDNDAVSQEWRQLVEFARMATHSQDTAAVISAGLDTIAALLPFQYAFVMGFYALPLRIVLEQARNLPHARRTELECFELPQEFVASMDSPDGAANFAPVVNACRESCAGLANDAPIVVPLCDGGHVMGMLVLAAAVHPEAGDEWNALHTRHQPTLDLVGALIGGALRRARLEQTITHSTLWYRTFVEESLDAFWETDVHLQMVYANRALSKILGIPHAELVGKSMSWLATRLPPPTPEDSQAAHLLQQKLMTEGAVTDFYIRFLFDGQVKTVSVTARAMRDKSGKVTTVQGSARDVTEQMIAHKELEKRKHELELLHELALRLNKTVETNAALDAGLGVIMELTGADAMGIWLINKAEGHYDAVAHRGVDAKLLELYATAPFDRAIYQPGFDPESTWNLVEYLVLTRRVLTTEDFKALPRFDTVPFSEMGFQSFLVFPMVYDEEVYGVVLIGSKRANHFDKQDVQLGENISAQLGLAIHKQSLIAAARRTTDYATALTSIGRKIQYAPRSESVLPSVVREIKQALGVDYVVIQLLRVDHFEVVTSTDTRESSLEHPVSAYEQAVLDSEIPLVVHDRDDSTVDAAQREILRHLNLRASVSMRLFVHDHPLGILFVNQEQCCQWNDEQINFVKRAAQQIAYALENKRLLDEYSRQVRELEALARAARLFRSVQAAEYALQAVADEIAQVFAVNYVGFHLRQNGFLELVAEAGYSGAPRMMQIVQHQYRILEELDTVIVYDRDNDPMPSAQREFLTRFGFMADLGVPLFVAKKAVGILYLSHCTPRRWTEAEVRLAETFAHQVASAIDNTHLFNELQSQVRDLRALARSANLIATSRSLQDALPQIAYDLRRTLNSDYVGFHLLNGDYLEVISDSQPVAGLRYRIQDYHRMALTNMQRIVVNDVDMDGRDAEHNAILRKYNLRADVGMPMVSRSKALGLLFVSRREQHLWQPEELQLIETFAQQIAGVVDVVQLLNEKQARVNELEQLAELNEITTTILDEDPLQDMALASLMNLLNADHVSMILMDGDQFKPVRSADGKTFSPELSRMTLFLRNVIDAKKPFIADPQHPFQVDEYLRPSVEYYGVRSAVSVPMVTPNERIGLLNFGFRAEHTFTGSEIRLAQAAANQLAMAFVNARMLQEQRTRIGKLTQLSDFSLYCGTIHDSLALQAAAVERICGLLEAQAASVRLIENGMLSAGAGYGYRKLEPRAHAIPIDARMEMILQQRKPYNISDLEVATDVPEHWRARHLEEGFNSLIMMPLVAENQVIGLLTIFHAGAHVWNTLETQYAQMLANTLALALSNVRQKEMTERQSDALRATMDSVFSGVLTTDADGAIVSWNRKAEQITGYLAPEMLEKDWAVRGPRVGVARRDDTLILEAMADNQTHFGVATRHFTRADGQVILLREVATPLRDREGKVRGAVCAFWDRIEEQEGERNKVDFINEVAHQLGNKLGAVIMSAQNLQRADLNDKSRERFIRVIANTVVDLQDFQKRFNEFQRERTREEIQEAEVSLRRLVDEKIAPLKMREPRHKFTVNGEFDFVYADPPRLGVVIENLLDNAFKYSPPYSQIKIQAECPAPDRLVLKINNKGKPIPANVQPNLFRRWQRGQSDKPGSGLGLWLVRTKLHEMGGEIHFKSSTREGTTFFVTLRRKVHQLPDVAADAPTDSP